MNLELETLIKTKKRLTNRLIKVEKQLEDLDIEYTPRERLNSNIYTKKRNLLLGQSITNSRRIETTEREIKRLQHGN